MGPSNTNETSIYYQKTHLRPLNAELGSFKEDDH